MKKKFMGIALVLVSVLFVGNVFAEDSAWKGGYGTVSDYTQEDALKDPEKGPDVTVSKANSGKDVTLTYDSGTFKLLDENKQASAGERPDGYMWVGFKVTLPENVTNGNYNVYADGELYTSGEKADGYYAEFIGVNVQSLEKAINKTITVTFGFDWNKDEKADQTVTIVLKPMNLTIYPKDDETTEDSEPVWTPEIAETVKEEVQVASVVTVEENGVNVTGTLLKEDDAAYKTMLEKVTGKGFKTVFGAYELKTEDNIGEKGLTLTFKVGTENNGRAAYILHQKKDGNIEEFNAVVTDGVVKINVSELSPFMVALGDVVKVKDTEPKTNDTFPMALVGVIALGVSGAYVCKKAREN